MTTFSQRLSIFFKGRVNGMIDRLEDPERSLHQVVLDMEEQLESAKRAASRAMANEQRLRDQVAKLRRDTDDFEEGARRTLAKGREDDARDYLERSQQARQRADELDHQLEEQARDTARVRQSVQQLHERLDDARARHQLLLAKMRQGEARRAMGQAIRGVESAGLGNEFERLAERVEVQASEDCAYLELDDQLSGNDLRRRNRNEAVADAVEDRMTALRAELATGQGTAEGETP